MSREKKCGTCINDDFGVCDRTGFRVEEEDTCEKHKEDWREALLNTFLAGHE